MLGALFRLEHSNIIAFLTSGSHDAPRVLTLHLFEFLDALARHGPQVLIPEGDAWKRKPKRDPWAYKVSNIASRTLSRLRSTKEMRDSNFLAGEVVKRLLEKLQSVFSDFPLFALPVGQDCRIFDAALDLARTPMYGQLLVLVPENRPIVGNFDILDPIPAFSTALHAAADWPGILFWTRSGASAFAQLDHVDALVGQLKDALNDNQGRGPLPPFRSAARLDTVLKNWSISRPTRCRRLLHLSDLHFGKNETAENQPLLDAELRDIVRSVDRVVITGDLFDSPKTKYATLFTSFRHNIFHLAGGREPILITGNHDQRLFGNIGNFYKQVALIHSTKILVEENCQMIFICFNSSVKGSFARGRITKSQLRKQGAEYHTLLTARPELKGYLPIVLVHHHPFSFDVKPVTWLQRALSKAGLREDTFLEMKDAENLHHWCLDWKIKTILHGHKHKAMYINREVKRENERMELTAIGCGSSLGAEGSPVSYNMLEWDPQSQRWVASSFESINGGAFKEALAAISLEGTSQP